MKNLLKLKVNIKAVMLFTFITFFSCNVEEEIEPENEVGLDTEEIALTPKTLATIQLTNNVEVIFKTEEDGVVFEATGNVSNFDGLGALENKSILNRFLVLTKENVPVPEDLIETEENQELKNEALKRGTIKQHAAKLDSQLTLLYTKGPANSNHCSGTPGYYDTDAFGKFSRSYKNYLAGGAGTIIYSSWKNNGNKCKDVKLWLSNCSTSKTLKARTYYKNIFGNYKLRNTVNISPNTAKFWSKTYLSRRYRKTSVAATGQAGHRFGGYLLFTDY
ncbi:hypothetical protein [Aquimarina macrocephali]|uniref:hypothetical protein n=1 Tax=Aquimarina macrocephali TaxID=666563 RepID=UPI000465136F|nr:hypothetical protein [Aquimarina macrocephali]